MKSIKVLTILGLFLLSVAPSLHAACSAATAAGAYGFTTAGTLILPGGPAPVAAVGLITFQLNGDVSGSQDRSVGGVFAHETITGSLTVNRDCTVLLSANVYDSNGQLVRTSTIDGVLVNNGKEIRAIFESVVAQPSGAVLPAILTIEAVRIH